MEYQYKQAITHFDMMLLNREIEAFCVKNALPPAKQFAVLLVLEELVTNIIKYGGDAEKDAQIEIRLLVEGEAVTLTIADTTAAFNPLEAPEPDITLSAEKRRIGGLGLLIVRKTVASISYENKDHTNIVRVVV